MDNTIDLLKNFLNFDNIAWIFHDPLASIMVLILILIFLFLTNHFIKYFIKIYRIKRLKALDLDISSPILIIPEKLGIIDNLLLRKYKTAEQKSRILFNKMYEVSLKEREKYDFAENQKKISRPRFKTKN